MTMNIKRKTMVNYAVALLCTLFFVIYNGLLTRRFICAFLSIFMLPICYMIIKIIYYTGTKNSEKARNKLFVIAFSFGLCLIETLFTSLSFGPGPLYPVNWAFIVMYILAVICYEAIVYYFYIAEKKAVE